jgi:hypothetical protein
VKNAFSGIALMKRKYALAVFCTLFGSAIAIRTGATLGEWTIFAVSMISAFGVADVADKKLNGGTYDEQSGTRSDPKSN